MNKRDDARPIRIATRGSALALTQTRWVAARLVERCPGVTTELVVITTEGDRVRDRPLSAIGGRGVFVKAIEDALLAGEADVAVHSLKDMPSTLPSGLLLAAIPEREDPHDVLVLPRDGSIEREEAETRKPPQPPNNGGSLPVGRAEVPPIIGGLGGLPSASAPPCLPGESAGSDSAALPLDHGARVGTSGPRRRALLRRQRPDLRLLDVRGNLDTRLRKLDAGEYDALVLAAAGLRRLGLEARISWKLPLGWSVPAVGQGALAVETRAEEAGLIRKLVLLDHTPSRLCVTAERAALARLGGGCTLPFGAHATLADAALTIHGVVCDPDGERLIEQTLAGPAADPGALGTRLAEALLAAGAADLMAERESANNANDRE